MIDRLYKLTVVVGVWSAVAVGSYACWKISAALDRVEAATARLVPLSGEQLEKLATTGRDARERIKSEAESARELWRSWRQNDVK